MPNTPKDHSLDEVSPKLDTTECPFCAKIQAGDYLFESPRYHAVAFQPLNPVVKGHMLFVPREHTENAGVDILTFGDVASFAADFADKQLPDYNLITSAGAAATQTIGHTHIHYIPRTKDDELQLPWTNQTI